MCEGVSARRCLSEGVKEGKCLRECVRVCERVKERDWGEKRGVRE